MPIAIAWRIGGDVDADWADYSDIQRPEFLETAHRAHRGEASQSRIIFDDDHGEVGNSGDLPGGLTYKQMSAHNVVVVTDTTATPDVVIGRGRYASIKVQRGDQVMGRSRQIELTMDDANMHLRGLGFLTAQKRPAETDVERMQWLHATYLSGSPRPSTDLASLISTADPVDMPDHEYEIGTQPVDVMVECLTAGNKDGFVTIDDELYYAPIDDTSYVADLRLSDREEDHGEEVVGDRTILTLAPIMPAAIYEGQELLSGGALRYGTDKHVTETRPAVASVYDYWVEAVNESGLDDEDTAEATERLAKFLDVAQYEGRTYDMAAMMTSQQLVKVKPGHMMQVRAKAIPDADDQFVTRRVAELRRAWLAPDRWMVMFKLDRPLRSGRRSPGSRGIPKPAPTITPDTPGAPLATWTWAANNLDSETGTHAFLWYPGTYAPADAAFGSLHYGYTKSGVNQTTPPIPISGGTDYTFSFEVLWKYDPTVRNIDVVWSDGTVERLVTGLGHATNTKYTETVTKTSPVGATTATIRATQFGGMFIGEAQIAGVGTPAENDPYALPDPGTSPRWARSDDPRFTNLAEGIEALTPHEATVDPTATDDEDDGHIVGSLWVNTATDEAFIATDVTVGAAVWESITASGGGGASDAEDVAIADAGGHFTGTDVEAALEQLATERSTLNFVIDGGASVIATGIKGDLRIAFACVIEAVTLLADASGSIVVDIWKDTYANFPPVDGDSITASAVPTISSAIKSEDATLTGWTTAIAAGDVLRFNVDSATTVKRVTVALKVRRT